MSNANTHSTITGIGYDGKRWILIDEYTQRGIRPWQVVETFRGEHAVVQKGSTPPHKKGSTGRMVTDKGEHYPSVYGCRWIRF